MSVPPRKTLSLSARPARSTKAARPSPSNTQSNTSNSSKLSNPKPAYAGKRSANPSTGNKPRSNPESTFQRPAQREFITPVDVDLLEIKPDSLAYSLVGAAQAVAYVLEGLALPQALTRVFTQSEVAPQARGGNARYCVS